MNAHGEVLAPDTESCDFYFFFSKDMQKHILAIQLISISLLHNANNCVSLKQTLHSFKRSTACLKKPCIHLDTSLVASREQTTALNIHL